MTNDAEKTDVRVKSVFVTSAMLFDLLQLVRHICFGARLIYIFANMSFAGGHTVSNAPDLF